MPAAVSDDVDELMRIFWKYPLSDQRFREIRDETEARKAAQGHLIAPDGHVLD